MLRNLTKRWMALTEELNELDKSLDKLTRKYASNLRGRFGVEPQTVATLLAVAGDNPERLKNYADKRTGEGLSNKEILRCLKRYIVRELYPLILSDLAYVNRPLLT